MIQKCEFAIPVFRQLWFCKLKNRQQTGFFLVIYYCKLMKHGLKLCWRIWTFMFYSLWIFHICIKGVLIVSTTHSPFNSSQTPLLHAPISCLLFIAHKIPVLRRKSRHKSHNWLGSYMQWIATEKGKINFLQWSVTMCINNILQGRPMPRSS